MDYKLELIKLIDKFIVESVEEFKEAEVLILNDCGFKKMFRKHDYQGNINKLKAVKKHAQKLNPSSVKVPESDVETRKLQKQFEKCMIVFNSVCDAYVQMQLALKEKAEGSGLQYKEYRLIHDRVKAAKAALNDHMHDMDILYSDFADITRGHDEEEEIAQFGNVKVMTYEDLK
ncbi:MAG: hypothetical protein PUB75_03870 [Firmicutes bacterium]|nr:hypothetical protein [Bacillota bacterium]